MYEKNTTITHWCAFRSIRTLIPITSGRSFQCIRTLSAWAAEPSFLMSVPASVVKVLSGFPEGVTRGTACDP